MNFISTRKYFKTPYYIPGAKDKKIWILKFLVKIDGDVRNFDFEAVKTPKLEKITILAFITVIYI